MTPFLCRINIHYRTRWQRICYVTERVCQRCGKVIDTRLIPH